MARIQRGKVGSDSLNRFLGEKQTVGVASGAVATESINGINRTVLTFTAAAIAMADAAGVVAYGSKKVYDFPEGVINIYGCVANLSITKSSAGINADFDGDFSVGSVAASNNATLSSTEADVIASTATPQAAAGATTAKGKSAATPVQLDGSSTAADLYLNFLVDDGDQDVTATPANLVVTGTIIVTWANIGDAA